MFLITTLGQWCPHYIINWSQVTLVIASINHVSKGIVILSVHYNTRLNLTWQALSLQYNKHLSLQLIVNEWGYLASHSHLPPSFNKDMEGKTGREGAIARKYGSCIPVTPYPIYAIFIFYFFINILNMLAVSDLMYAKVCSRHYKDLSLCSNSTFTKAHPELQVRVNLNQNVLACSLQSS